MHPPSAGIRVPSIHVRDVAASSVGLITDAANASSPSPVAPAAS